MPTPAAAINAVVPSSVVSFGSAPAVEQQRASAGGRPTWPRAETASRRSGSACCGLPSLGSFCSRAFTFAPCATSFLTSSRLSIAPGQHGAGHVAAGSSAAGSRPSDAAALHPCASAFGSAPSIDQERGQLVVGVHDRQQQRAGAVGQRLVDVGAGVEQDARGLDVTRAHGKQVRREHTAVRSLVEVGAGLEEQPSPPRVIVLGRRPHQRGLPLPAFLRVHVGAVGEQRLSPPARRRSARRSSAPSHRRAAPRSRPRPPPAAVPMIAAFALVAASESGVTP